MNGRQPGVYEARARELAVAARLDPDARIGPQSINRPPQEEF
jgi:hypothetical protein